MEFSNHAAEKIPCLSHGQMFIMSTKTYSYTCCQVVLAAADTTSLRERGGVVVERRTPNREVLGSIPTGVIVLCP